MKKITLIAMSLVMAAITAFAQSAPAFPTDGSAIEAGTIYSVKAYSAVEAVLTPATSGTLAQYGCGDIMLYNSDGTELSRTFLNYGSYGSLRNIPVNTYQVEAGKVYTAKSAFVMDDGEVLFIMADDIELEVVAADPAQGSVISTTTNGAGDILLSFNAPVSCTEAYVVVGSKEVAAEVVNGNGTTLTVRIASALKSLMGDGTLSPDGGQSVIVSFRNVKNSAGKLYNNTGVVDIAYKSAPKAVDLRWTDIPVDFKLKSYIKPHEGEFSFNFDGNLSAGARYAITYGDPASEKTYFIEDGEAQVWSNFVTIDLSGRLRDLSAFYNEELYGANVGLQIYNVRDAQGNLAEGQGTGAGSYAFSFPYEYIEPFDVAFEFTPAPGSSIAYSDEIEIWFNHASRLDVERVDIEFLDYMSRKATAGILKSDLDIAKGANDECTVKFSLRDAVKGGSHYKVSLDVKGDDGYPHEISALFDQFVATLVAPITPGQAIAQTGDDDFVVTFNNNDYGYYRYDFYNGNAESQDGWFYGSWFNKQEDGTWKGYNCNAPCFTNYEPRMVIRAYDNEGDYWANPEANVRESFTFTFRGTQAAFEYSSYEFVSIDPEPNSMIEPADDFCFTAIFNGLVRIDTDATGIPMGFGGGLMPFERIEAAGVSEDDPEGFASTWKFYPGSALNGRDGIEISIKAYDQDGNLIKGNMGGDAYDYLSFGYGVHSAENLRELVVSPADGSTLEELFCFTISKPGQFVTRNPNYEGQLPYITDRVGMIAYQFVDTDIEVYSEITGYDEMEQPIYDENSIVYMYLSTPINIEGVYFLNIPEGVFDMGAQMDVHSNAEYFGVYNVGTASSFPMSIDPANNDTVDEIAQIFINTTATVNPDCEEYITLYSPTMWSSVAEWSQWSSAETFQTLSDEDGIYGYRLVPADGPITANDSYMLTIPANFFVLNGEGNPETYVTINVGEAAPVEGFQLTITPADGTDFDVLGRIEIRADGLAGLNWMNYESITITDIDNNLIFAVDNEGIAANQMLGDDMWTLEGYYIEPHIIAAGTYFLNVPARFFEGLQPGSYNESALLMYTVKGGGNTLLLAVEPADKERVESIEQIYINTTADLNPDENYDGLIKLSDAESNQLGEWNTRYGIIKECDAEGNVYRYILTVPEAVTADGTYTLHIDANFFVLEGLYNREMTFTYYIGDAGEQGTVDLQVSVADGATVAELTRVEINASAKGMGVNWLNNENIKIFDEENYLAASIDNENVLPIIPDPEEWWNVTGYYFETNITEAGVYTLIIPDSFFEFDDMSKSKKYIAVITVTGMGSVDSIVVEESNIYTVYNLMGVKVMETTVATDLANLAPGCYIINGRKVLVK